MNLLCPSRNGKKEQCRETTPEARRCSFPVEKLNRTKKIFSSASFILHFFEDEAIRKKRNILNLPRRVEIYGRNFSRHEIESNDNKLERQHSL